MQKSERTALVLLAAVVVLLIAVPLSGGGMMHAYGYGMMGPYAFGAGEGWGWLGWLGMALGMAVFWVAVTAGVVLLARALAGPTSADAAAGPDPARAVLRRRLAAGEITETEYEHLRGVLEHKPASAPQARTA